MFIYTRENLPGKFSSNYWHEFSGVVEDTGKEVKNFKAGDRVTVNPNLPCGKCEQCRLGKEHLCTDLLNLGVRLNGGFAEYVKAKETLVYKLPEEVDLELASLSEPLSCCIHGIEVAQIKAGDSVLAIGCGPIGLLMVSWLKSVEQQRSLQLT